MVEMYKNILHTKIIINMYTNFTLVPTQHLLGFFAVSKWNIWFDKMTKISPSLNYKDNIQKFT